MDFNISRDYARTHVTHSLTTTELKEKKRKKIVKPNWEKKKKRKKTYSNTPLLRLITYYFTKSYGVILTINSKSQPNISTTTTKKEGEKRNCSSNLQH